MTLLPTSYVKKNDCDSSCQIYKVLYKNVIPYQGGRRDGLGRAMTQLLSGWGSCWLDRGTSITAVYIRCSRSHNPLSFTIPSDVVIPVQSQGEKISLGISVYLMVLWWIAFSIFVVFHFRRSFAHTHTHMENTNRKQNEISSWWKSCSLKYGLTM